MHCRSWASLGTSSTHSAVTHMRLKQARCQRTTSWAPGIISPWQRTWAVSIRIRQCEVCTDGSRALSVIGTAKIRRMPMMTSRQQRQQQRRRAACMAPRLPVPLQAQPYPKVFPLFPHRCQGRLPTASSRPPGMARRWVQPGRFHSSLVATPPRLVPHLGQGLCKEPRRGQHPALELLLVL